jgi:ABC-type multidrug transport system permease subunit
MFASSLFYPLENLPVWFRTIARLNPVTWQTDALRYATLGAGDLTLILIESAAFLGFTIFAFFGAVRALNHAGE